jgi:competence protein ComEA
MDRRRFESLTTKRAGKQRSDGQGSLARYRPHALVAGLVIIVLLGGAFYASRMSDGVPRTVYSASLEEMAADAQPPVVIRVNSASSEELQELPGIGPALAERIIEHRQVNGAFRSLEDLEEVSGIGPKTIEQIRPYADV